MLEGKDDYKCLGKLEKETLKKQWWKKNKKRVPQMNKKNFLKPSSAAEISLNLDSASCKKLRKTGQKTRKLFTMREAFHLKDNKLFFLEKKEDEDSQVLRIA